MDKFTSDILALRKNLVYFASSLTNDSEDAHDLFQDTYLKALENKDKYEPETNLKAWLFTIMKNTFINNYRKKIKFNKLSIDENENLLDYVKSLKSDTQTPEDKYFEKQILKHIETLSDLNYGPFKMFVDGYGYEDIADIMEISIGTVKSRIFFARKFLMNKLTEN